VREVKGIITPQTVMQFLQNTWREPSAVAAVEKDASSM